MPKLKTHSGAAKRFKVTKNKKFKFARAGRRHLLECKSAKQSRTKREPALVHDADWKAVSQLLPYA